MQERKHPGLIERLGVDCRLPEGTDLLWPAHARGEYKFIDVQDFECPPTKIKYGDLKCLKASIIRSLRKANRR